MRRIIVGISSFVELVGDGLLQAEPQKSGGLTSLGDNHLEVSHVLPVAPRRFSPQTIG